MVKLGEFCGFSVNLKCPLPGGDLETLISITSDEDLANLIEEYYRASASSSLPLKIRAILTQSKYLKSISPPSSAAPSVVNFSTSTSNSNSLPFGTLNSVPNRTVVRRGGSPIMGYPISHQREYGNFCYHPSQVQRNPNKISCQHCDHHNYYHHQRHQQVPQYSNYRQWRGDFNFERMVDEELCTTEY